MYVFSNHNLLTFSCVRMYGSFDDDEDDGGEEEEDDCIALLTVGNS